MKDQPKGHRKYMPITHNANMTFRCHTLIPEKTGNMEKVERKRYIWEFYFCCHCLRSW